MTLPLALLILLGATAPAMAHEGGALRNWPAALPVALAAALILAAWTGRHARIGLREAVAVTAGLTMLVLALFGPLPMLEDRSLAAHMVQHELLMAGAAPLLASARCWRLTIPALPFALRRGGAAAARAARRPLGFLLQPLPATLLAAVGLWAWHVPAAFLGALEHPAIHALQHATFFATALLFWAAMQAPAHRRREAAAALYLFATALHTGALGALMAFSAQVWYPLQGAPPFGLTALEDQQLAGLIMWIPGGLVYAAAALLQLGRMLARPAPALPLSGKGA